MGMKDSKQSSETLNIFQALVDQVQDIEIKGAKSSYCAANGNMFCFLASGDRLALRLPKDEREKFLSQHADCVCIEHATVMKDYVLVPDSILHNNRKLRPLFKKCCEHAFSLKPKPTTKKKRTAAKKAAKPKPTAAKSTKIKKSGQTKKKAKKKK